ncbi:MAG: methyltransferase [Betaproteobacteria bacterium]|nr:methyltransferase [Betaproteobacteria bacterium]
MLLPAIIFICGGAILALELLASRIMTPYFGVSLYIWTGILSITLVALAVGYWTGGKLANSRKLSAANLLELYGLMPALASIFIVVACLIYPFTFAALAAWSVVGGSFIACLIFLLAPLVATSAMNPLLVAIKRGNADKQGDSGAGLVFFVSTIGSVAGVLITAFVLIPNMSNFDAVLLVAVVLALLALAVGLWAPKTLKRRAAIIVTAAAGLLAALLLWWQADAYTGRAGTIAYQDSQWRVEASFRSYFGTVKIIKQVPDANGNFRRLYFQDGLTQNAVDSNGRSSTFYTYALEALALAYRPQAREALVLGLGAGVVPAKFAGRGIRAETVEIDSASLQAARRFFNLDEKKTPVHQTDARTFVQRCPRVYDVIVVDLFHGDGTPDYLITRDFFRDLKHCLKPNGVAVFNTFADLQDTAGYAHLLVTLRSELPHLALYRPINPGATHSNSFIVAGAQALAAPQRVTLDHVPRHYEGPLWDMLAAPLPLIAPLFEGGHIITDARNRGALDLARTHRGYRQSVIGFTPPQFLLN